MAYIPPIPERGSGVHRIVCLLLNSEQFKLAESKNTRTFTSFSDLIGELGQDSSIVAYNFFTTTWTRSVSESIFPRIEVVKERLFGEFVLGPGQKNLLGSNEQEC